MFQSIKKSLILILVLMLINVVSGRKKRKAPEKRAKPPEILKSAPLEFKVQLNDTVCLPCAFRRQYEGENKILFYWKKDQSAVIKWRRFTLDDNHCLRIERIESFDHGTYICHAENQLGSAKAIRKLTVINRVAGNIPIGPSSTSKPIFQRYPVPPFLRDSIKVKTALIRMKYAMGKKVKLKCEIEGSPSPKIYWLQDGRVIKKSAKFSIRPRKKLLVVKDLNSSDTGNYTCVGSNSGGVRHMTYIIKLNKQSSTKSPPQEVIERRVRSGDNVTLECKVPAINVTYLVWNLPNTKARRTGERQVNRDLNPNAIKRFVQLSSIQNEKRVQKYLLINVTKALHQGLYKCVALFRTEDIVVTIKIIKLIVEKDIAVINGESTKNNDKDGNEEFPLNIVLPAACVAFFLLLVFMCICFAFRRKARRSKGFSVPIAAPDTPQPFDEDPSTMQILPICNYDSLRKHNTKSERTSSLKSNSSSTNSHASFDVNINISSDVTPNADVGDHSNTHTVSSCNRDKQITNEQLELKVLSDITSQELSNDVPLKSDDKSSWPGEKLSPGDSDYTDYCDESDRLLLKEYPSMERTKKYEIKQNNVDNTEYLKSNSTSSDKLSCINHLHNDEDGRPASMDSEEEDQLLQHQMRNWEPLIRNSCTVGSLDNSRKVDDAIRAP